MAKDEIVKEVRGIRDEYARSLNYNLKAIFKDLKEKEAQGKRDYVSLPPKKPTPVRASKDEADGG